MHRKKLKELNLLDDFLFFKMLNYPEFGEEFSRALLKVIIGRDFGKLSVIPQKVYYGSDTDKHGARMDVYLEESIIGDELLENAKNDTLKKIHSMVEVVKRDKGVTLEYMKIFEREQMLREEGREEGREEERANTERERQRAKLYPIGWTR